MDYNKLERVDKKKEEDKVKPLEFIGMMLIMLGFLFGMIGVLFLIFKWFGTLGGFIGMGVVFIAVGSFMIEW